MALATDSQPTCEDAHLLAPLLWETFPSPVEPPLAASLLQNAAVAIKLMLCFWAVLNWGAHVSVLTVQNSLPQNKG